MEPKVLSDELVAVGRRVKLLRRWVEAGGVVFERDVVVFGEVVVIVPILDSGMVVMVRQWRAPVGAWLLEVPAGRVEGGESPVAAAKRELEEETGYSTGELLRVASVYATPGYSDEVMHIFTARKLSRGQPRLELGEVARVVEVDPSDYLAGVGSEAYDLKTVAALLLCRTRGVL